MLGLICSMQYLQLQHENSQLRHVEPSSLTRDWNQAPASGAWSHSRWTTREVPWLFLTLISVQLPSVLHVSSLFSHLHTFASAVLPLLPETHGPLLGGWSRRGLLQEWKTSFWDTVQWSGPHPTIHGVKAERDPIDPTPDIVRLLEAWAGEV